MKKLIIHFLIVASSTSCSTLLHAQEKRTAKEVFQIYHEQVWERKNFAAINDLVDPAMKDADLPPDTKDARPVMIGFLQSFFSAFPDLKVQQRMLFGEGENAVELWTLSGTMTSPLWGMPATNKRFEVTGMDILKVKNGKIVEHYGGLGDQMDKIFKQLNIGPYTAKVADNGFAKTITSRKWKHTASLNTKTKADVSKKYPAFVGLGEYKPDGTYEFFNLDGSSKGDKGTWSVSEDGKKLSIVSSTLGYKANVDIVRLDEVNFDLKAVQYNKGGVLTEAITVYHTAIKP